MQPAVLAEAGGHLSILRCIGLIGAFAVASSAFATQNNYIDYGRPVSTPENRADMALRGAAFCAYRTVPASARRVLETSIASAEEATRVKALPSVARKCFRIEWPAFQSTTLRNAIAEAAYRDKYLLRDPAPPGSTPARPPETFAVVPVGQQGTPEQQTVWQLAAIAKCTVFAGPEESRQLVLGPRNVDEEQRRFTLLQGAIRQCVPTGELSALTARNFRGFVAYALLERAAEARGSAL